MAVTAVAYVGLLTVVALFRGVELLISRRHQQALDRLGAHTATDPHFVWMVALHAAILIGAALEVILLRRPFIPLLAIASGAVVVLANALRWWVIYTLGTHWNVRVVDSAGLGVITSGPFRVIRHPNYVAVFLELAALPLVHTAWVTALVGSAAHVWVLSKRLVVEEALLQQHADYRTLMMDKPRFVPRISGRRGAVVAPSRERAR
jgi:methyltransferase